MRSLVPAVVQVVGLLMFLAGFYLLAGLAWSLLVAGVLVVVVSVFTEFSAPREGWKDGT